MSTVSTQVPAAQPIPGQQLDTGTPTANSFTATDLNPAPAPDFEHAPQLQRATAAPAVASTAPAQQLAQAPASPIGQATEAYKQSLAQLKQEANENPFGSLIALLTGEQNTADQKAELETALQNLNQLEQALRQQVLTSLQNPGFANYAEGAKDSSYADADQVTTAAIKAYNAAENKADIAAIAEKAVANYLEASTEDEQTMAAHLRVLQEKAMRDPNNPMANANTVVQELAPIVKSVLEDDAQTVETIMQARLAKLPEVLKKLAQGLVSAADKITADRAQAAQQAAINPAPVVTTTTAMPATPTTTNTSTELMQPLGTTFTQ